MEKTAVQKLAGVLKILVTITFVCNLAVLVMVPGLVHISVRQGLAEWWQYDADDTLHMLLFGGWGQWGQNGAYADVLSAFLLFCGVCTAVILWQGRRVLGTILAGNPFQRENGVSLRRAGMCCFAISARRPGPGGCGGCSTISPSPPCSPTTPCLCPSFCWAACSAWWCPPCSAKRRS